MSATYLLFDLDGTLTDSKEGILRCVQYALAQCGRPEPEKIGSFWPRTRVFSPSMVEMPVWMNSLG